MDTVLVLVIIGAAIAGLVQGLSGFAFGLTAMAFWAWNIDPQLAGPMVVFGGLLGQVLAIRTIARGFDFKRMAPMIIGGVIGIPAGVALLGSLDQALFKLAVGGILAIYCPIMLLGNGLPRVTGGGGMADASVGFIGGVMGGFSGLPGPAPTLWAALRGWDKDASRASFQSFNLVMQAVTMTLYAINGLITTEALRMFAIIAPAMLIPSLIGIRVYGRFSDATFRRIVLGVLSVSGLALLVSSGLGLAGS